MEVAQARAFLAVADHLHFGRAAQQLSMGHAPLSRMISQLERTIGAQLFARTTRTVELTSAGHALLEPARNLVDASEIAIADPQVSVVFGDEDAVTARKFPLASCCLDCVSLGQVQPFACGLV